MMMIMIRMIIVLIVKIIYIYTACHCMLPLSLYTYIYIHTHMQILYAYDLTMIHLAWWYHISHIDCNRLYMISPTATFQVMWVQNLWTWSNPCPWFQGWLQECCLDGSMVKQGETVKPSCKNCSVRRFEKSIGQKVGLRGLPSTTSTTTSHRDGKHHIHGDDLPSGELR